MDTVRRYVCSFNVDENVVNQLSRIDTFLILCIIYKIHKPARKQAVKKQNLKLNCNKLHFLQICSSIQRLGIMHEVINV
ncbi:hypothetical protein T12_11502 [Trichinella patagoniensis]|uniref:Uncharacterized protein n=1 Tax=Trichinella patagoniensis TaxID=990121 RepID=A0A0V0ZLK9_9BILA|nr:hypothetical protein T12_14871 [Trichinella patagoniensis]KRY09949.1 hypothetical protein T12_3259 [Trichinella patagoniensis]KRY13300.1 hypothetical protein T12_11502 [Trichinella patagoniensis]